MNIATFKPVSIDFSQPRSTGTLQEQVAQPSAALRFEGDIFDNYIVKGEPGKPINVPKNYRSLFEQKLTAISRKIRNNASQYDFTSGSKKGGNLLKECKVSVYGYLTKGDIMITPKDPEKEAFKSLQYKVRRIGTLYRNHVELTLKDGTIYRYQDTDTKTYMEACVKDLNKFFGKQIQEGQLKKGGFDPSKLQNLDI